MGLNNKYGDMEFKKYDFLEEEYLSSVESIDSIIDAQYTTLWGEAGEARNWELYKFLFHPEARLIRYEEDWVDGVIKAKFMTVDDYINGIGNWLETKRETGFYENEAARRENVFSNIAHVFSTYQSFNTKKEMEANTPYSRGICSFQLLFHEDRWWIIDLYWTRETLENPIPDEFLGKSHRILRTSKTG